MRCPPQPQADWEASDYRAEITAELKKELLHSLSICLAKRWRRELRDWTAGPLHYRTTNPRPCLHRPALDARVRVCPSRRCSSTLSIARPSEIARFPIHSAFRARFDVPDVVPTEKTRCLGWINVRQPSPTCSCPPQPQVALQIAPIPTKGSQREPAQKTQKPSRHTSRLSTSYRIGGRSGGMQPTKKPV